MSVDEGEGRYCVELDVSRDEASSSVSSKVSEASSSFMRHEAAACMSRDETSTSLVRDEASSSFTRDPVSRDADPAVGKAPAERGGGGIQRGLFVCPSFMRDPASASSAHAVMRTQGASFTSVESGEEALMAVQSVDVC